MLLSAQPTRIGEPRFSLDTLERWLAGRYSPERNNRQQGKVPDGRFLTDTEMCSIMGRKVSYRRQLGRWREAGGVPLKKADAIAIDLGVHPLIIWPDFNADIEAELEFEAGLPAGQLNIFDHQPPAA